MKKMNTKTLVLMALFAAISIILARFFVIYLSNSARISFGNIPILLASLLLGPFAGALTAAVADILGSLLFSPLSWYPPLTIPPIIVGALPALLKPILLKEVSFWRIYLVIIITDLLASLGLTNYLLSGLYGTGYFELLTIRAPIALGISIVEGIVVYILYKRLNKQI
jgi:riboflavin transporter